MTLLVSNRRSRGCGAFGFSLALSLLLSPALAQQAAEPHDHSQHGAPPADHSQHQSAEGSSHQDAPPDHSGHRPAAGTQKKTAPAKTKTPAEAQRASGIPRRHATRFARKAGHAQLAWWRRA